MDAKIKVVGGTGINGYFTVNGVRVGRVVGYRGRDHKGVVANFRVLLDDGREIADGYSYYRDIVRDLPHILSEAGII
jgi:hypothetical protein